MRKSILAVTAGVVLMVAITSTHAEKFNALKGDAWVGGGFEFMSAGMSYKNFDVDIPRQNMLSLSPIIRFFPADNFTLGPKLAWTGIYVDDASANIMSFGGEFGYVSSSSTHSYIITSPHLNVIASDGESETMFMLPFTAGLMAAISGDLGLQFEIGYSLGFHENITTNTFSIGIGICGFGEKLAISMVNVLSALASMN